MEEKKAPADLQKKLKILVVGNVEGQFRTLFNLVENLQEKGGIFDYLFCVGKFFAQNTKDNKEFGFYAKSPDLIPCQTYFIDSTYWISPFMHIHRKGYSFNEKLHFLGRSGIHKFRDSLRVAFVSGLDAQRSSLKDRGMKEWEEIFTGNQFVVNDYINVLEQAKSEKGVDILLTNEWPYGYEKYLEMGITESEIFNNLSMKIGHIAEEICPKYHFASQINKYFPRPPYLNKIKCLTRIFFLGSVSSEQKYIYGMQIIPQIVKQEICNESMLEVAHTPSPFLGLLSEILISSEYNPNVQGGGRRTRASAPGRVEDRSVLFVGGLDKRVDYDVLHGFLAQFGILENIDLAYSDNRGSNGTTSTFKGFGFATYVDKNIHNKLIEETEMHELFDRKIIFAPRLKEEKVIVNIEEANIEECWFCFANPKLEGHLIVSEGTHSYVALPKGAITANHFLILPKQHMRSMAAIQDLQTKLEIKAYILELIGYLSKCPQDYILFERNLPSKRGTSLHLNLQIIGISPSLTLTLRSAFNKFTKYKKLPGAPPEELPRGTDITNLGEGYVEGNEGYFYIEFFDLHTATGRTKCKFLYKIPEGKYFDAQFGRQFLCEVMDMGNKFNWKKCVMDKEAEVELVKSHKGMMKQLRMKF